MLAVVQPAPSGLRLAERGSACLRFVEFRGSLDVVHFRYGPSVHLPQLPTPPRGGAVEVVFRREQPNSTGGTCTHVQASFPGAGSVTSCLTSGHPLFQKATGLTETIIAAAIEVHRDKGPGPNL